MKNLIMAALVFDNHHFHDNLDWHNLPSEINDDHDDHDHPDHFDLGFYDPHHHYHSH